jgi:hypothetical protein
VKQGPPGSTFQLKRPPPLQHLLLAVPAHLEHQGAASRVHEPASLLLQPEGERQGRLGRRTVDFPVQPQLPHVLHLRGAEHAGGRRHEGVGLGQEHGPPLVKGACNWRGKLSGASVRTR